jgi:hypothetical protein
MRRPTPEELRGAVADHLRQEVFYREALARGFDREDSVVRMAMVNKIRMLAAVQAEATEPTDEEIEAFFALRKERYRTPGRVSFIHVYYSPDERGEKAQADAEADLAILRQRDLEAEELVEWGDTTLLPATLTNESEDSVERMFGAEFAQSVWNLPPGDWNGPVESPYGLHLVRVEEKTESTIPEWTEVRDDVLADLRYEARKSAEDQLFAEMASRFEIIYDPAITEMLEGDRE